jgi:hypothetical protein
MSMQSLRIHLGKLSIQLSSSREGLTNKGESVEPMSASILDDKFN